MQLDEKETIRQCLHGNKEAYAVLVETYKLPLFNLIFRLVRQREEAQDLTQEAFIKAYENLWRYNCEYEFSTWLLQIAKNLAFDYLRKKRPVLIEEEYLQDFADEKNNPEKEALQSETKEELKKAIEKLPVHLKAAIVLYHINNLPYQEISKVLGVPLHTVKNQLFQGRKKLKELLQQKGSDVI